MGANAGFWHLARSYNMTYSFEPIVLVPNIILLNWTNGRNTKRIWKITPIMLEVLLEKTYVQGWRIFSYPARSVTTARTAVSRQVTGMGRGLWKITEARTPPDPDRCCTFVGSMRCTLYDGCAQTRVFLCGIAVLQL